MSGFKFHFHFWWTLSVSELSAEFKVFLLSFWGLHHMLAWSQAVFNAWFVWDMRSVFSCLSWRLSIYFWESMKILGLFIWSRNLYSKSLLQSAICSVWYFLAQFGRLLSNFWPLQGSSFCCLIVLKAGLFATVPCLPWGFLSAVSASIMVAFLLLAATVG